MSSPGALTAVDGSSAHGAWPAIFFLMASACARVMSPFLTSSSSVWPTAFWNAASTLVGLLPRFEAKCDTKSLHTAEALPVCRSAPAAVPFEAWFEEVEGGRKPTLMPAAEAVIHTAPAAMATAHVANPTTRKARRWRKVAMFLNTP